MSIVQDFSYREGAGDAIEFLDKNRAKGIPLSELCDIAYDHFVCGDELQLHLKYDSIEL